MKNTTEPPYTPIAQTNVVSPVSYKPVACSRRRAICSASRPSRGAESLAFWQSNLNGGVRGIHGVSGDVGTPPRWETCVGQLKREEDQDGTQRQADVQSCRQNVGVVHPPSAPAVADVSVEDKTCDTPGEVVQRRRGGNQSRTAEDDGRLEVPDDTLRPVASTEVDCNGQNGAREEEPHETGIYLTGRKHPGGADDTPNDGSVEEYAAVGAGVVVGLMWVADALDCSKCPVHRAYLDDRGPHTGNTLSGERHARRELHVVS